MKNFLSTYVLCLFLVGFLLLLCASFAFNVWITIAMIALPMAVLAAMWREHDHRIETLEKRIQDLEHLETHIEEKENEQ